MRIFIFLFLIELGNNILFGLESSEKINSGGVDVSYYSNNLKVNQMRIKNEVADVNISSQNDPNNLDNLLISTKVNGISKKENMNNINDSLLGSNSLRTSEIIYNGTQILTLIFFVSVLFFGIFILIITLIPKYANKLGFRNKRDDEVEFEKEINEVNMQEDSERKFPQCIDRKENLAANISLPIIKGKNHSLRRHSLISDGSSDHYKISTRPRSSSSLPFVQAFTDTADDITTGDESTCRMNKNTTLKNFLKKRSSNTDLSKNKIEEIKNSSNSINNMTIAGDEDESGFSPTSASAVVAIQMSELIARWNPKKDSRLIQKMNSNSTEKNF